MRRVEAGSPYYTHRRTRVWQVTGDPASTRLTPRGAVADAPRCLIPFDRREGLTVEAAADLAARDVRTLRRWCVEHGIGRRIAGGPWTVSRVALAMLLDGDASALATYLSGDRGSDLVRGYFDAAGLSDLPRRWARQEPVPG